MKDTIEIAGRAAGPAWARQWMLPAAVAAGSLVITFLFVWLFPASLNLPAGADYSLYYEPCARSLLAGNGYRMPDGAPCLLYPPGYSFVLAGVFGLSPLLGISEPGLIVACNALFLAAGAVALFAFARRTFGPARASAATLVFVTYPFLLYLVRLPSSEIVFTVPFYVALILFGRLTLEGSRSRGWYVAVGLLLGLATLVRPIALGTGLLAAALLLAAGRSPSVRTRAGLAAALVAGNVIAVLPWQVWVHTNTGKVVLLSTNGPPSAMQGFTFALDSRSAPLPVSPDVKTVMLNLRAHRREIRTMGDVAALLGTELRRDPAAVVKLVGLKAVRAWYASDSRRLETLTALVQVLYLLGAAFCTVVAFRRGGAARQVVVAVWIFAAYFWCMALIVLPLLRYMVPAMGLLFLTVAAALPDRRAARLSRSG